MFQKHTKPLLFFVHILCTMLGDKVMDMVWLLAMVVIYPRGEAEEEQTWHSLDGQQVALIHFVALEAFDY